MNNVEKTKSRLRSIFSIFIHCQIVSYVTLWLKYKSGKRLVIMAETL